jgi:hypothetical protein
MDHLPYPDNPQGSPLACLEIPFICSEILRPNGGLSESSESVPSFNNYLGRVESNMYRWKKYHGDDDAREAQANIYFGLLKDILGPEFHVSNFVQFSKLSGERVISLADLEDQIRAVGPDIDAKRVKDLSLCANQLGKKLRMKSALANTISLSIEVLTWSLVTIVDPNHGLEFGFGTYSKDIFAAQLQKAGWCDRWTSTSCSSYPAPLLHYLSGFPPETHAGHESCTPLQCEAHQIRNWDSYVSHHVTDGCSCDSKGPTAKQIADIIDGDHVPLIKLTPTLGGDIDYKVVKAEFGTPFIAISHVWSGGLGNPNANKLPVCQLKFLYDGAKRCQQKEYGEGIFGMAHRLDFVWKRTKYYRKLLRILGDDDDDDVGAMSEPLESYLEMADRWALYGVNEISDSLYIWCDTLCIPVEKDKMYKNKNDITTNLKSRAINKMAFVYAAAMHVMVIDQTVRNLSYDHMSDLELAAKLLTSPWMTRCWTFQEACLARQFSFVLKDRLIDPRKWLFGNPSHRGSSKFDWALKRGCLSKITSMPDIMNQSVQNLPECQLNRFVSVWNHLAQRSTTQAEEFHGLLAVMLNLSAAEILNYKDKDLMNAQDRRMLAVLRSQDSLPLSMLLLSYPKDILLVRGFHWVPRYPSGILYEKLGSMTWDTNGAGLRFLPSDTKSILLNLGEKKRLHKKHCIVINRPSSEYTDPVEHQLIRLEFLHPFSESSKECEDKENFVLLHEYVNGDYNSPFGGLGACFTLSGHSNCKGIRLTFVCPLQYQSTPYEHFQEPKTKQKSVQKQTVQDLLAESIPEDVVCLLECCWSFWSYSKLLLTPF